MCPFTTFCSASGESKRREQQVQCNEIERTYTSISKKTYHDALHKLQIELVKMQRHFIKCADKILIILERRDVEGKDGKIKRIVQHLSPRETRVNALGKQSDRNRSSRYLQRYVPHFPAAQEFVLFSRSWYNRAGAERVLGLCTDDEYEEFMGSVSNFENILVRSGVKLLNTTSRMPSRLYTNVQKRFPN